MVLGLGLAGTGIAYVIYYYIVDRLGAVTAASISYLPPVVALIIGWFLVHEPIDIIDIFAMLLILFGVFMLKEKNGNK